ncbi:MAG: aminotransferase class V-fold PLP-dependent enzyme [Anaerolineales bacterium]|nr:aminotransferase class V-fold PLP-dependent enzyme [Anaerolineales bacterium]
MDNNNFINELKKSLKPYHDNFLSFKQLPKEGHSKEEIIDMMKELYKLEEPKWKEGFVSGSVYHGDLGHIDFQNQIYALNSQSNPLHFDIWPSAFKFEAEIISMTANMLGAKKTPDEIVGTVSSGGTDSILLAMKTYRDWARDQKGITEPEMVVPTTAHAAFDKASQYFCINMIRIPVGKDYRADVKAMEAAITDNTIVMVGSAPQFPHGVIDPIEELSEIARKRGIGFHTDACLGGFILPWAEKLGYEVPPFDFRLPGVTTMSADTHKYGYAAKGTSVVLYRGKQLRHYQYFVTTEWPGGLYLTPTFLGSRAGALSAECWAAMVAIGENGYMKASEGILKAGKSLKDGIRQIPELYVFGDPLFVIAFSSAVLDVHAVCDVMSSKGWSLSGLQKPACVHISLTQRHAQPGVIDRLVSDLKEAVAYVKQHPEMQGSLTPIYGMTANINLQDAVINFSHELIDLFYET